MATNNPTTANAAKSSRMDFMMNSLLIFTKRFAVRTQRQRLARARFDRVAIVFRASIVVETGAGRHLAKLFGDDPGLRQRLRVFDRHLDLNRSLVDPLHAGRRMRFVAKGQSGSVENDIA